MKTLAYILVALFLNVTPATAGNHIFYVERMRLETPRDLASRLVRIEKEEKCEIVSIASIASMNGRDPTAGLMVVCKDVKTAKPNK